MPETEEERLNRIFNEAHENVTTHHLPKDTATPVPSAPESEPSESADAPVASDTPAADAEAQEPS